MTPDKVHEDIRQTLGVVPEWLKQVPEGSVGGFWDMTKNFWMAETRIPNKYKELIGLAVSGATRCRYCSLFHTEAARLYGATNEEIAEASMMGAVTMLGSTFINAQQLDYEHFKAETAGIIKYVRRHAAHQAA
jgi:AhpD family alkylhydroperoxidase